MFFLNIAEKPSVAKSISYTLSSSTTKTSSPNKYTPNYKFDYKSTKMLFTSLLGHLFHHDFVGHKDWSRSDPKKLLNDADIHKLINQNQETIKQNILHNSRYADTIILWTDCDREGENIAMEVKNLILETYPNKIIKRARFNAISYSNIVNALENLVDINVNESDAVNARIELDLRLGSAFTRIQTINIKRDTVISYGPCQIPTLNFVVERMVGIGAFVPEEFYSLKLKVKKKVEDVFDWVRGNAFDKNCVIHVYERLIMQKYGIVIDVNVSHKEKARPLPLRTVEMQKACSSLFKISSHQVMQIAEGLYTKGYISYPRTETDVFPKNFDFKEIINKLSNDYAYCQKMNELFTFPRHGSNNDMAHSPIYPLKSGAGLANNDKRIFDFIARRFLGCISKNAIGEETNVKIKIANEEFALKGLLIKERNYLEIYTYDSWNEKKINDYVINEKISVQGLDISDGKTSPPELITEPELISLMDKNGIGTDATIAEHIQKIQDRAYVYKKGKYFIATNLGKGLIFGYNELGLQNFVKPYLRCELEKQLKCICEGRIGMREVVRREIETYLHFYDIIANGIGTIKNKISECDNIHQDDDSSSSSSNKPSNKPKNARTTSNKQIKYKKDDTDGKNVYKQKTDAYTKKRENQAPSNYKSNTKKQRSSIIQQNENYGSNNTENETKVAKISAIPICHCKQQAVKSIVKKDTGNKGKAYYRCSKYTDGCKFFQWAEDKLECYCNYEPQIKTSRTENNNGRQFYCCKKAHKPCKYFKWIDG